MIQHTSDGRLYQGWSKVSLLMQNQYYCSRLVQIVGAVKQYNSVVVSGYLAV